MTIEELWNRLGWEEWQRKKDWIESRDGNDPDMAHAVAPLWNGSFGGWLAAYSEYVRTKAATIGQIWDTDSILWQLNVDIRPEAERRFGDSAFRVLEERVRQDATLPLDPEKIANAREFLRPFEDHRRSMAPGGGR